MNAKALVAAALLAGVGCSRTRPSAPAPAEQPTVVVLSFDALANRFLDRDSLPAFHRLMADGVRAPAQPEFPSKTFGNHYAMATGLTPGHNGIVLNQFFDPARKEWFHKTSSGDGSFFNGEPIWVSAEKAGLRTANYFWFGGEAEIDGVRPTYWYPYNTTTTDVEKFGQLAKWFRLPAAQRPRLIMLYSAVVDSVGHKFGPDAPETAAAVRRADVALAALRDTLAQFKSLGVDLIIVSDHGLSYVPHDHDIPMDGFVPPKGALVDNEHATFALWQDPDGPVVNFDSLAVAYRKSIPHIRVFQHGQFPVQWLTDQNPRFGDIFLLADPGYEFIDKPGAASTLGEHGYDPATPDMMGTFLAAGPDFRRGVLLDARENRSLHDLLATLLHLDTPRTTTVTNFGLKN
ncbi:MAG TPA: ectonucleotide pyrophosphatase/phosphodiesterase [Gemmatimonadaceae bacterium]|jgi:predicted AlkP superfamily pyrophosphatase or phosphodiesterase